MLLCDIQSNDAPALATLLGRAFENDPGLRWIIEGQSEWERISQPYFQMLVNRTIRNGLGYTNQNKTSVALWEPPNQTNSTMSQLWHLLRVYSLLRGNLNRAIRLQTRIEKYRPRHPVWYLSYIATDPDCQGQGEAGALLQPVLELADKTHQCVYLDCSNRDNLSFYLGRGFRMIDEVVSPDGPTIWPMVREPRF